MTTTVPHLSDKFLDWLLSPAALAVFAASQSVSGDHAGGSSMPTAAAGVPIESLAVGLGGVVSTVMVRCQTQGVTCTPRDLARGLRCQSPPHCDNASLSAIFAPYINQAQGSA